MCQAMRPFVLFSFLSIICGSCQIGNSPLMSGKLVGVYRLDTTAVRIDALAEHLDVPWELCYVGSDELWYTLQSGEVWRLNLRDSTKQRLLLIPEVYRYRTLGLLGMTVHKSGENTQAYLIYNKQLDSAHIVSRLVQYTLRGDSLVQPKKLLEWPGNTGHNGARVVYGADNNLYLSAGDRAEGLLAQDLLSPNGKILRLKPDGQIPVDNPFTNSYVWSYGHRNIQGLAIGRNGKLYASEHGDAIEDEVNWIQKAKNYGWPLREGKVYAPQADSSSNRDFTDPLESWTPTVAPAAMTYYKDGPIKEWRNCLLLVTLKGSALYVLQLNEEGNRVVKEQVYFKNSFGRLRGICVGPDGAVYVTTSNRDWNPAPGYPKVYDDRILRIAVAHTSSLGGVIKPAMQVVEKRVDAAALYRNYCASCHKENGLGVEGVFPPLKGNPILNRPTDLFHVVFNGKSPGGKIMGKTYDQAMPGFSFLKDEEVAEILTYISQTFGNNSNVFSATQITEEREKRKK